jgi:hypothetical protein
MTDHRELHLAAELTYTKVPSCSHKLWLAVAATAYRPAEPSGCLSRRLQS